MRTHFASVVHSRSFQIRVWVWLGVIAVMAAAFLISILVWFSGHHVVRTQKGVVVVAKRFVGYEETFADIRQWTWDDAVKHSDLSQALVKAGYDDVLPKPPHEPGTTEKAAEKIRQWRDEAVSAGTNVWQRLKEKYKKEDVTN